MKSLSLILCILIASTTAFADENPAPITAVGSLCAHGALQVYEHRSGREGWQLTCHQHQGRLPRARELETGYDVLCAKAAMAGSMETIVADPRNAARALKLNISSQARRTLCEVHAHGQRDGSSSRGTAGRLD